MQPLTNRGLAVGSLVVVPLLLAALELFHPAAFTVFPGVSTYLSHPQAGDPHFNAIAYFGPDWWFLLHMIQTPLIVVIAFGLLWLTGPFGGYAGARYLWLAWISRIAINCCYDELRRAGRRPEDLANAVTGDEADWFNIPARSTNEGGNVEARVISRDLANKLLARLKPDDRLILTLIAVEEMSVVEIAKITEWSVAKVKVRDVLHSKFAARPR